MPVGERWPHTLLEVAPAEVARGEAQLSLCPERRVPRRRRSRRRRGDRGEMRPPQPAGFFGRSGRPAIRGDRARQQQQFGTQIGKAQFAQTENRAKRPLVLSPTRLYFLCDCNVVPAFRAELLSQARSTKSYYPLGEATTWSARTWMGYAAQRVSCALARAVAWVLVAPRRWS